jgi:hypothetical protein
VGRAEVNDLNRVTGSMQRQPPGEGSIWQGEMQVGQRFQQVAVKARLGQSPGSQQRARRAGGEGLHRAHLIDNRGRIALPSWQRSGQLLLH